MKIITGTLLLLFALGVWFVLGTHTDRSGVTLGATPVQDDGIQESGTTAPTNIYETIKPRAWLGAVVVSGVLVIGTTPGSPADLAGLKVGDVISKVNEIEVRSYHDFLTPVLTSEAGTTVSFAVFRLGDDLKFHVSPKLTATLAGFGESPHGKGEEHTDIELEFGKPD